MKDINAKLKSITISRRKALLYGLTGSLGIVVLPSAYAIHAPKTNITEDIGLFNRISVQNSTELEQIDPVNISNPIADRTKLFLDIADDIIKRKQPDGSIIPLSADTDNFLLLDGSRSMTGDFNLGNNVILNIGSENSKFTSDGLFIRKSVDPPLIFQENTIDRTRLVYNTVNNKFIIQSRNVAQTTWLDNISIDSETDTPIINLLRDTNLSNKKITSLSAIEMTGRPISRIIDTDEIRLRGGTSIGTSGSIAVLGGTHGTFAGHVFIYGSGNESIRVKANGKFEITKGINFRANDSHVGSEYYIGRENLILALNAPTSSQLLFRINNSAKMGMDTNNLTLNSIILDILTDTDKQIKLVNGRGIAWQDDLKLYYSNPDLIVRGFTAFRPDTDGNDDLGKDSQKWKDIYFDSKLKNTRYQIGNNGAYLETIPHGVDDDMLLSFHPSGTSKFNHLEMYGTNLRSNTDFLQLNLDASNQYMSARSVGSGTRKPIVFRSQTTESFRIPLGRQLQIFNSSRPSALANYSFIYARDISSSSEMFVLDEANNETRLTSHDFSKFNPDIQDQYPFTFSHSNRFLGKEQVIDMSKLVRLMEGLTGEKLLYNKDITKEDWNTNQIIKKSTLDKERRLEKELLERERKTELINIEIEKNIEIEVTKDEALEQEIIEERELLTTKIYLTDETSEYILDKDGKRILIEENPIMIDTGKYELNKDTGEFKEIQKQDSILLRTKINYKLKDGYIINSELRKFFRKKTILEIESEISSLPITFTRYRIKTPPKWLSDRGVGS